MMNHFYVDYSDTVVCSEDIKQMCSSRADADAIMTLFLELYSCRCYGDGTSSKAIYHYDDSKIAIEPTSDGKLYVSVNC